MCGLRQDRSNRTYYTILKVSQGKFSIVFLRSFVVGAGGFKFVIEIAEVVGLVVAAYRGDPFFVPFVPADAFVF